MALPNATNSSGHIDGSDWRLLPLELLRSIFLSFAIRPRLLVISRVCLRWRTAVYLSIESVPAYLRPPSLPPPPYHLFPDIRSWDDYAPDSIPVPGRLRFVTIYEKIPAQIASLSSLTSLYVDSRYRGVDIWRVLENNATTLTDLHLGILLRSSETHWPRLTSLRSLSIASEELRGTAPLSWIHAWGAGLTSLSAYTITDVLLPIHLAGLATLKIATLSLTGEVLKWLQLHTSLTSLETRLIDPIAGRLQLSYLMDFLRITSSYLTALRISRYTDKDVREITAALVACPKLCRVVFAGNSQFNVDILTALGSRLTSIHLDDFRPSEAHYREMKRQCTGLTSLSLVDSISLDVLEGWHLPNLRSLRAYTHPPEWLAGLLRLFPSLIEVTLAGISSAKDYDELLASVRAADKRGMETILLRYGQTLRQQVAPTIRSLRWLSFSLDQSPKMTALQIT